MLSVGIVGLPNVGKSTLFNALLKKQAALAANYPFATVEPNVGIVPVPDIRLEQLADLVAGELFTSKVRADNTFEVTGHQKWPPIIPATVRFVDIAGLVKGASQGDGLGNQFLAHIREVDALVEVVRDFHDENVVRAGAVNPAEDVATVNTELCLADLQTIQKSKGNLPAGRQKLEVGRQESPAPGSPLLAKLEAGLNNGRLVSDLGLDDKEKAQIRGLNLLTAKPIIYALNVDESDVSNASDGSDKKYVIRVCAKLEAELSELTEAEQADYLAELGVKERGLDKVIRVAYEILGLITYFTAGPKEVRAWTIAKGDRAPAAAGKIHTDFERGFIAAEVVYIADLLALGSFRAAREQGKIRLEGRDYPVADGDVIEFRFSV